jgi:hypothetical protein
LTIIATTASSVAWLQTRFHMIDTQIISMNAIDDAIMTRITTQGFSREQAQKFIDDLRDSADHPVPAITPWNGY